MDTASDLVDRVIRSTLVDEYLAGAHEHSSFFVFNMEAEEFVLCDGERMEYSLEELKSLLKYANLYIGSVIVYNEDKEGNVDFTNPAFLGDEIQQKLRK